MAWAYLLLAGVFEIIWAIKLKQVAIEPLLSGWLMVVTSAALSLVFLSAAMRSLPITIAYPLWVGIGIVGTVIAGVLLFGEHMNPLRILGLLLLLGGMVALKAS